MNEPQAGSAPAPSTTPPANPDQPAPLAPRSALNWGKWVAEIGVVVVGVLLALGAQQTVEAMSWDEKVKVLEGAIRAELSNDLGLATELKMLHPCVTGYLDTLQTAVIDGDNERIRKLNELGAPIFGRAWPRDT
ncbi:MAG TPA: hypothetical protein PLN33_13895 [Hyphomonadaceae bacterium]|mgnify:CR=1 FL=1|jgi:hypothetical protein|nr:hypothetical protein [Hyphomonadaceae bacterium]HPN04621.1 hypothetical protein [Hyphomonadaceae bacterium]